MKRKKFSLIELMVVIVIISLLAGVALPTVMDKIGKAKIGTAKSQIVIIEQAIDDYFLDTGKLPTSLDNLMENSESIKKWKGPYLKRKIPKDPWGNKYVLNIPGEYGKYDILSYGADGASGGEEDNRDIGNWTDEDE